MVIHKFHMHKSLLSTNNVVLIKVFTSFQGHIKPPTFMLASILEVCSLPSTVVTALWL